MLVEIQRKMEKEISKGLRTFALIGFAMGYLVGMGTAFFIAMEILKWHK